MDLPACLPACMFVVVPPLHQNPTELHKVRCQTARRLLKWLHKPLETHRASIFLCLAVFCITPTVCWWGQPGRPLLDPRGACVLG